MAIKPILPKPAPRVIAVGDLHGCATALATMLDGLKLQPHDAIIMLGDAIDRGPDSRGVIDRLMALRDRCQLVCIQGNHEQMLLDVLAGRMHLQEWTVHGGAQTLDSYGAGATVAAINPEHIDFIASWGDYRETPSHFFCHGNYLADRPLARQPWRDLRWQSLKWHVPRPHLSGKTAVVGHTSNKSGEILNLGYLICVDTYCHGGGWLTAFDSTTGRVWQSNERGDFRAAELPPIRQTAPIGP